MPDPAANVHRGTTSRDRGTTIAATGTSQREAGLTASEKGSGGAPTRISDTFAHEIASFPSNTQQTDIGPIHVGDVFLDAAGIERFIIYISDPDVIFLTKDGLWHQTLGAFVEEARTAHFGLAARSLAPVARTLDVSANFALGVLSTTTWYAWAIAYGIPLFIVAAKHGKEISRLIKAVSALLDAREIIKQYAPNLDAVLKKTAIQKIIDSIPAEEIAKFVGRTIGIVAGSKLSKAFKFLPEKEAATFIGRWLAKLGSIKAIVIAFKSLQVVVAAIFTLLEGVIAAEQQVSKDVKDLANRVRAGLTGRGFAISSAEIEQIIARSRPFVQAAATDLERAKTIIEQQLLADATALVNAFRSGGVVVGADVAFKIVKEIRLQKQQIESALRQLSDALGELAAALADSGSKQE